MRAWSFGSVAFSVSVPKTAVNENDLLVPWENDIGIPRELLLVKTKPIAHPMNQ
jgi:hypothetical protein